MPLQLLKTVNDFDFWKCLEAGLSKVLNGWPNNKEADLWRNLREIGRQSATGFELVHF